MMKEYIRYEYLRVFRKSINLRNRVFPSVGRRGAVPDPATPFPTVFSVAMSAHAHLSEHNNILIVNYSIFFT